MKKHGLTASKVLAAGLMSMGIACSAAEPGDAPDVADGLLAPATLEVVSPDQGGGDPVATPVAASTTTSREYA